MIDSVLIVKCVNLHTFLNFKIKINIIKIKSNLVKCVNLHTFKVKLLKTIDLTTKKVCKKCVKSV